MLTRRGRELSKTSLTLSEETSLRRELRVFPFSATGLPAPTSFTVYVETPTTFIVPPFWTSETSTSEEKPQDTRSPGKKVSMPFHGTLRPTLKQPEAYDAIVHHFQQYHGGVMCLPTGYGKKNL